MNEINEMNENMMCEHCNTLFAQLMAPSLIAVGDKKCSGSDDCTLSLEPNSAECIEVVTSSNS